MKAAALIMLMVIAANVFAQQEPCRDVKRLQELVWKKEQGGAAWIKTIDSVINLCPASAALWGDKGLGYMIRGEFVEGMKYFSKAAELDPYYYLGTRAWYRMRYLHDYKGAISDFESIEKVAGTSFVYVTSVHMYILKALSYQELGEYDKALETYNVAINDQIARSGPEWVGSYDYLHRGILLFHMKDMEGAIEDLTRQVKEYESLADTYYYRGLAYAAVGRKDEARVDLQQAKNLMLGDGQRRWDSLFVLPDEVFLSDVEKALLRLY